jgi:hypothetical protein
VKASAVKAEEQRIKDEKKADDDTARVEADRHARRAALISAFEKEDKPAVKLSPAKSPRTAAPSSFQPNPPAANPFVVPPTSDASVVPVGLSFAPVSSQPAGQPAKKHSRAVSAPRISPRKGDDMEGRFRSALAPEARATLSNGFPTKGFPRTAPDDEPEATPLSPTPPTAPASSASPFATWTAASLRVSKDPATVQEKGHLFSQSKSPKRKYDTEK